MLIVSLSILFYMIIMNFIIELLDRFKILLILIDKFLKLIKLILNKLINSVKN